MSDEGVSPVSVNVIIHFERADDGESTWWAEAPTVPGFSAAAGSLAELRISAEWALRDIGEETGAPLDKIRWHLAPTSVSDAGYVTHPAPNTPTNGPGHQVVEGVTAPGTLLTV